MENTENKNHLKKTQKDYSLAFNLESVNEIEKGYLTFKKTQKNTSIQAETKY